MHGRHIAHCDISLENILVDRGAGAMCIIDFGLAVATDFVGSSVELSVRPASGKLYCMAPEVCATPGGGGGKGEGAVPGSVLSPARSSGM